jgi:hypothetical protein
LVLSAAVVALAVVAVLARNWLASPEIKMLVPEHGAQWIHQRRPFDLRAWGPTQEVVFFRKKVRVPAGVESAVVTVRAMRSCMVYWDQKDRVLVAAKPNEWKEPHLVELKKLTPGEHTIDIFVENSYGPAACLVYCDALNLRSGPDWEQNVYGEKWLPAATVDDVEPPPLEKPVASPLRALAKEVWWLGPLFLAVFAVCLWANRNRLGDGQRTKLWTAARCRWIVIAAWLVLAANNFLKLPVDMGYDEPAHVDYIRFVAERGELPDASDGWQMFQAPLFYIVAAAVYRGLILVTTAGTAVLWLRWLTLLCGVAQVELCYRAGRLVFPGRDDLQSLAILFGGLLPMNLYMSQTLGNEPLCGVISAVILLWCWRLLCDPEAARAHWRQWSLGVVFGLDLITKMSAILFGPILAVVLAVAERGRKLTATASVFGRCFIAAAIVSSWYYIRNYLRFGKFLMGGWDPSRGLVWWQDPGYRTPWQMVSFGKSLFQPIHAGVYSLADGFFASFWLDCNLGGLDTGTAIPWNMNLLVAAPWPGLVLSAAIVAGMLRGVWCQDALLRRSLLLAAGSVLLFVAAFVLLWLEVPAYSQAKASYTLGLAPAYAVLCVAGLDLLPANRWVRAAVNAFVVCWSVMVYATYFAR